MILSERSVVFGKSLQRDGNDASNTFLSSKIIVSFSASLCCCFVVVVVVVVFCFSWASLIFNETDGNDAFGSKPSSSDIPGL